MTAFAPHLRQEESIPAPLAGNPSTATTSKRASYTRPQSQHVDLPPIGVARQAASLPPLPLVGYEAHLTDGPGDSVLPPLPRAAAASPAVGARLDGLSGSNLLRFADKTLQGLLRHYGERDFARLCSQAESREERLLLEGVWRRSRTDVDASRVR